MPPCTAWHKIVSLAVRWSGHLQIYRFTKSARISNRWISFLMDCETEWRKKISFCCEMLQSNPNHPSLKVSLGSKVDMNVAVDKNGGKGIFP